jgi:O-acetyl-ADP-ribose deacetylase (regulator of RNase III)
VIEVTKGNLLSVEDVDAIVNTVNTVGVMGKGVALQFKKAYPDNFTAYESACKRGEVQVGRMFVFDRQTFAKPRFIINFPTKKDWKHRSKYEYIEAGLADLVQVIRTARIESVALPPLGCGNGGLEWPRVLSMIRAAFAPLNGVRVLVFEPKGAPAPEAIVDRTERPKMTRGAAITVALMREYLVPTYEYLLSLLELHKLAYFMQEAGEKDLKLEFTAGPYGPYAENYRHLLNRLEGHFVRGIGDGKTKPNTPIRVLEPAIADAAQELRGDERLRERLARVAHLIEGYETPSAMELLATTHWVGTRGSADGRIATNADEAVALVQAWSTRKAGKMKPEHIRKAWSRLTEQGWIAPRSRR